MKFARIVIIILFITSLIYLIKPLFIGYYPDFSMHYFGTKALLQNISPYAGGEHFFIPHVYPPFTSIFFIPLIIFTYNTAELIWVGCSIVMYLVSIFLLFSLFNRNIFGTLELFIFTLINATFFPLKFTFGMGQVNTFVLLCICLFLYFTQNKKNSFFAGNVIAFSLAMKLFPILLIPYLLFIKKWKIFFSFVVTFAFLLVLSLFFFGFEIHKYFITNVLPSLTGGWKDYYYNQSIGGFISVMVFDQSRRELLYKLLASFILIPTVIVVIKKKSNFLYCTSIILIVSLLVNKFSWQHHFVLILPSLFILIFSEKSRTIRIFTGIAYGLLAFNFKNPNAIHPLLQFHVMYGACIIYGLTLYRLLVSVGKTKK